jgi:hypothetical protein
MKKISRLVVAVLVLSLLLSSFAFAATAESNWGYISADIFKYKTQATIYNSGSSNWFNAGVTILVTNAATVPAGYMGVKARIYNDSGVLQASSDYYYNDKACAGIGTFADKSKDGTFYSKGLTKIFNGNGYDEYNTFQSPFLTYPSSLNSTANYGINQSGMSFGSDMMAETSNESPDLISAVGVNGRMGYVRATELNAMDNIKASTASSRTIPVYDVTGMSIIDCFEIVTDGYEITK